MGCEGMMDMTEVGPTEETVAALMEYLVAPLLPMKHTDIPSESQQKAVAKQVHAAAVLHNYYHLKQHRENEFLTFEQFCHLAIMFTPSILHYMKYMFPSNRPVLNDPENQLSLTEKAIMDACAVSETLLDASANISSMIKEWPITKVAVLLVDSKRENCYLQFDNGVWSVLEKNLDSEETEIGSGCNTRKKRRISLTGKHDAEETWLQQLAFSAVKEVAEINDAELKVLEDHVVYSLSQAKAATRFYIVESTRSISEESLVPLQDAICSLQGPVVKECSGSWVITPVVEYYYLLPYGEIISQCFSRISNSLPDQVEEGKTDANIILGSHKSCESKRSSDNLLIKSKLTVHMSNEDPHKYSTMEHVKKVPHDSQLIESCLDEKVMETKSSIGPRITGACGDGMKQKDTNGSHIVESANSSSGIKAKDIHGSHLVESDNSSSAMKQKNNNGSGLVESDNSSSGMKQKGINGSDTSSSGMKQKDINESLMVELDNSSSGTNNKDIHTPVVCLQKENQSTKMHIPLKVYQRERTTPTNAINIKEDLKNTPTIISEGKDEIVDGEKKSPHEDRTLTPQNVKPLDDLHCTTDTKRSELSEAALQSLLKKREKLEDPKNLGIVSVTDELQLAMDSKRRELSEAALGALLKKREKLCNQQRNIEAELSLCDKKIEAIMHGGVGDWLDLKLEAVIDCCNEICR